MYPAIRTLVGSIRQAQATPLLFQTWAHREGWPEQGLPTYRSMQAQIDQGYRAIGGELNVQVVAVGDMPNDLPMLQWAGVRAVVANAHPLLHEIAHLVLPANDDDGVATLVDAVLAARSA